MKIILKNIRQNTRPNQVGIIKDFISFLQDRAPLKNDIVVIFTSDRTDHLMTTGRQIEDSIKIFVKERILIDIMRTLAHEWVHELQFENSEDPQSERKIEDHANSLSGFLIRKFVSDNPHHEAELYKD